MDRTFVFFFIFFTLSDSPRFHSAAVISGVRHPASTTTDTILVLPLLPPLVGVEESEAEEEEEEEAAAVADERRRLAFRAGLPASRDEVELIPREGGTERRFVALELLLLRQATRAEAAAAEAKEMTR